MQLKHIHTRKFSLAFRSQRRFRKTQWAMQNTKMLRLNVARINWDLAEYILRCCTFLDSTFVLYYLLFIMYIVPEAQTTLMWTRGTAIGAGHARRGLPGRINQVSNLFYVLVFNVFIIIIIIIRNRAQSTTHNTCYNKQKACNAPHKKRRLTSWHCNNNWVYFITVEVIYT